MKTLICLGYGYTARALARRLARDRGWRVVGTVRSEGSAGDIRRDGGAALLWTDAAFRAESFAEADAVLVSTPPDGGGCPAFRAAGDAIWAARPGWIGYLSANSVYGDYGGAWIDETAALRATSERGLARIAAEDAWKSLGARLFRLPGIYGPGRSAIDSVRAGRAQRVFKEGQVFNRIHVEDIAAGLAASIANPGAGAVFNLSDDEPAPPQDVIAYACMLLDAEPPPLVPIAEARLSEMAASFYDENKRVRNERMKRDLGVGLQYPTYREGLRALAEAANA